MDTTDSNNNWIGIVLGAIGIYLLFRNKKTNNEQKVESTTIDSYKKFRKTPLGQSIDDQLDEQGVLLDEAQVKLLDDCLKGLSKEDYKVIEKASKFVKKEDVLQALSEEEIKVFIPIRKKIMMCLDNALI